MTTASKYAISLLFANEEAIKEHRKVSDTFLRKLITTIPQAAFVLLSLILQCQTLWFSVKNVLQLHGGVKKPQLTLSSFISFILHSHFQDDKPLCEGLTDSHQFLRLSRNFTKMTTLFGRGFLLLFIHWFPFHVIVISILKVNIQLIGTGHTLEKHFHDNHLLRDWLWIQKITHKSAHSGSAWKTVAGG